MMTQGQALACLARGDNVFLTGEPGAGKSYLIREYVSMLRDRGVLVAVTASTGAASILVGGRTIHSWSGIRIEKEITEKYVRSAPKYVVEQVVSAQVLIIDEVSMLSADTLDNIDTMCRGIRFNQRPFGGLQVVLVGDLFQLPPVPDKDIPNHLPGFVFESKVWERLSPTYCYLSEQHRQSDQRLLKALGQIRRGEGEEARAFFESRITPVEPKGSVLLYCHNFAVDYTNEMELAKLPGKPTTYQMLEKGLPALIDALKQGCGSPATLQLKVGAQVMFTKNDKWVNGSQRWVNGTLGVVVECFHDEPPLIRTRGGHEYYVGAAEWTIEETKKRPVGASIFQLPLRLAWALTIHRVQGASLDAVHVDTSQAFVAGQGYVAFSRARNTEGLTLSGLNAMALKVDEKVLKWDSEIRGASTQAAKQLDAPVARPHIAIEAPRKGGLFAGIEDGSYAHSLSLVRELPNGEHEVEIVKVRRSFLGVFTVEFKTLDTKYVAAIRDDEFGGMRAFCFAAGGPDVNPDNDTIEYVVSDGNPLAGEKLRLKRVGAKYTWSAW